MRLFKKKEPQTVEVAGNLLRCPVCNNDLFWTRTTPINSSVSAFFNLPGSGRIATCFVCSECTHISWFLGG